MSTSPPPAPSSSPPSSGWTTVNPGSTLQPKKSHNVRNGTILALTAGLGGWFLHRPAKHAVADCPPAHKVTVSATSPDKHAKPAHVRVHAHKDKSGRIITTQITPNHIKTTTPTGLTAHNVLNEIPDAATPAAPIYRPAYNGSAAASQQTNFAGPPPGGNNSFGPPDDFAADPDPGINPYYPRFNDGYNIPYGSFGPLLVVWVQPSLVYVEYEEFRKHCHHGKDGKWHYDGGHDHIKKVDGGTSRASINNPTLAEAGLHRVDGQVHPGYTVPTPVSTPRQPASTLRPVVQTPNKYSNIEAGRTNTQGFDHKQSVRDSTFEAMFGNGTLHPGQAGNNGGTRGTENHETTQRGGFGGVNNQHSLGNGNQNHHIGDKHPVTVARPAPPAYTGGSHPHNSK